MASKALGFAMIAGGVALAGVGVYVATRKGAGALGRSAEAIESGHGGGFEFTHHRHATMPIAERVRILQERTAKSVKDPRMRKIALSITNKCKARDDNCEGRAIYDWIRKNIRYTGDVAPHLLWTGGPVEGVDLFQSAYATVDFKGGDCDDHSILACTTALLNGIPCRYRVTSPRRGSKDDYTHIYPMIGLPKLGPKKWVAIDTTLPGERYGYEAPYAKRLDFVA